MHGGAVLFSYTIPLTAGSKQSMTSSSSPSPSSIGLPFPPSKKKRRVVNCFYTKEKRPMIPFLSFPFPVVLPGPHTQSFMYNLRILCDCTMQTQNIFPHRPASHIHTHTHTTTLYTSLYIYTHARTHACTHTHTLDRIRSGGGGGRRSWRRGAFFNQKSQKNAEKCQKQKKRKT